MLATAVTTITDPDGRAWPLDDTDGLRAAPGRRGFHAPSYAHWRDESPAVDGAFYRGSRVPPRDLFLPVHLINGDPVRLLATRRGFVAALSPERGECVLTVAYPDGSSRHIRGRYLEGMEGAEDNGGWGIPLVSYGLRFIADDPYFYGDDIPLDWQGTQSRTELPIPGADTFFEAVSGAQVLGVTRVDNTGDVDAWPFWTFHGPFTAITLANDSSGRSLTLTHTAAGTANAVTIQTRPGQTAILDEAGANLWNGLSAGYSLWPLLRGRNDITITVSGSTSATLARMVYPLRFKGS